MLCTVELKLWKFKINIFKRIQIKNIFILLLYNYSKIIFVCVILLNDRPSCYKQIGMASFLVIRYQVSKNSDYSINYDFD